MDLDAMVEQAAALHRDGDLEGAATGYRAVLDVAPRHPNACNLLALIALELRYLRDAVELTRIATEEAPEVAGFWNSHADALAAHHDHDAAIAAYRKALELEPERLAALYNLAVLLHALDRDAECAELLEAVVALAPDHGAARHLLAAVSGQATDGAPPDYVRSVFDGYASFFDHHLRDVLGYRVPEELAGLVAPPEGAGWTVLDLGCGTGMSGEPFRAASARLIGCDLSPSMLAAAAFKQIYDQLLNEDVLTSLARFDAELDLVIAADVLIYVGAPAPVFAACARALRPGGRFAFSVEAGDQPLELRRSGRYAHSAEGIESCAADAGLDVVARQQAALRRETSPLEGWLYVLSRPA